MIQFAEISHYNNCSVNNPMLIRLSVGGDTKMGFFCWQLNMNFSVQVAQNTRKHC